MEVEAGISHGLMPQTLLLITSDVLQTKSPPKENKKHDKYFLILLTVVPAGHQQYSIELSQWRYLDTSINNYRWRKSFQKYWIIKDRSTECFSIKLSLIYGLKGTPFSSRRNLQRNGDIIAGTTVHLFYDFHRKCNKIDRKLDTIEYHTQRGKISQIPRFVGKFTFRFFCVNQWEEEKYKYFTLFRYWLKSNDTFPMSF
jgi:hypothetical protein